MLKQMKQLRFVNFGWHDFKRMKIQMAQCYEMVFSFGSKNPMVKKWKYDNFDDQIPKT